MKRVRVIPALLLKGGGLVKSIRFKNHAYVGDPINAVKIFNEKEVDELVLLDISATVEKRGPNFSKIKEIASEAFMPLAYGGGISTLDEIKRLIEGGVEKVVLNTVLLRNPKLVEEAARYVGSQSIMISMDVKKNFLGRYRVYVENGYRSTHQEPVGFAQQMERMGAGELLLNAIDRDGTFAGYDLELIGRIAGKVNIPLVAAGGAASVSDFLAAIQQGASGIAAGSYFVFQRPHRAVLISYPSQQELYDKLFSRINERA